MANLEIACFNADSAFVADRARVSRIELCTGAAVGGTTPALQTLHNVKRSVSIPVYVMIRPRGGDFVYTASEYEDMKRDIKAYEQYADGFVFGILEAHSRVDVTRNSELVEMARPKPCTFHRAFDEPQDPIRALEDVARCGFTNVLTSGGASNAPAGAERLTVFVKNGKELGVTVMPGGGVRSSNIAELVQRTGADWYHSSAIVGTGDVADLEEITKLKDVLRQRSLT